MLTVICDGSPPMVHFPVSIVDPGKSSYRVGAGQALVESAPRNARNVRFAPVCRFRIFVSFPYAFAGQVFPVAILKAAAPAWAGVVLPAEAVPVPL